MLRKIMLIMMAVIMAAFLTGCSQTAETGIDVKSDDKVQVLVSILPQADFVKTIGGDQVDVSVLIPPGANPEDYEMSPRQVGEISKADIYFAVGNIPFEVINLERIKSANSEMPVINAPVHKNHPEETETHNHDPHVWLSPNLVMEQVQIIYEGLSKIDAANEALYLNNKDAYIAELERLDREIKELLTDRKKDSFLVYHPAWGYFAADYGLTEVAVEKDGKEPTASEMARLIETAKTEDIKTVLVSPQHNTRSAETIARQLGGQVKKIDPLPADYLEDMRETAKIFKEVLND